MKNTQKGFIVPLLVAIIVVMAIGGGVYFYSQKNKTQTQQNNIVVDNSKTNSTNEAQTIMVTSPRGGEVFTPGQKVTITWQEKNINKIYIYLSNLSSERDFKDIATIASSTDASVGSYTWTVPNEIVPTMKSNEYFINIVKFDYDSKGLNAGRSKPFAISSYSDHTK